jgi:hypothetical protein
VAKLSEKECGGTTTVLGKSPGSKQEEGGPHPPTPLYHISGRFFGGEFWHCGNQKKPNAKCTKAFFLATILQKS